LWKLNVKNKRSYCILPITKVVLKWWALNEWVPIKLMLPRINCRLECLKRGQLIF
jgi:hypothetical protein